MGERMTIDEGRGSPTLVLVHGFCCHGSDWQGDIEAFSKTYRVIAPTLIGHDGDNVTADDLTIPRLARDVAQQLEDRDITDAVLCGHSLGMRVVLEAHAIIPDRVSGIVLMDGSNMVAGDLDAVLAGFDAIPDVRAWVQDLFGQMFLPGTHLDSREMYRKRIAGMPTTSLSVLFRNMIIWDAERLADRLERAKRVPMLVQQSTIRPKDGARRSLRPGERGEFLEMLAAAHPNCRIETYPDANHFINLDQPERMRRDIQSWLVETQSK